MSDEHEDRPLTDRLRSAMHMATAMRSAAEIADDPNRNRDELIQDRDRVFSGYVVSHEGAMYYVAEQFDHVRRLPAFVRSTDDAQEFFEHAAAWRRDGFGEGQAETRRALRDGLKKIRLKSGEQRPRSMTEVSKNTCPSLAIVLTGAGVTSLTAAQIMYPIGSGAAGANLLFSTIGIVCMGVASVLLYLELGDREKGRG